MSWTVERVGRLKELWSTGISCSLIAASLGDCTRNMIIGKAHRMGLERRMPTRSERPKRERIRKQRVQRFREVLPMPFEPPIDRLLACETIDESIEERMEAARKSGCHLMELTERTCRWPLWTDEQPERLYCGAVALERAPYCGSHMQIAWRRKQ